MSWHEAILPQTAKTLKDTTSMGMVAVIFLVGIFLYAMILMKEWTDND
jgi:hypothetical protein